MPSNFLDDFLQGVDPMDAATLFAGIRNSVPLSMLFRSGDTNAGHDEELAKRQGPRMILAPPPIDPAESIRRAQMDFEMQYPDPRIRQLLIDEMLKQARDPYSPTTATRRRDFEEVPMSARHYMSATPEKKKFAKGGGVKKTLDEMMAEMAQKLKPQPQPDLSRRKFFGLGKAEQLMPFDSAMKLNSKDPAFQEALALYMHDNRNMFKNAPAVTEKTVTVDPGKGAAKSTLKSLSETPMSRREVLQSTAGQVMRGVLPDLGGLGGMGNVAKIAESVAPAAVSADMAPGLIMAAIKRGMSEEEAVKFVRGQLGDVPPTKAFNLNDPKHVQLEAMYKHLSDPEWAPNEWEFFGPMRPSGALNVMLHTPSADVSPLQLRGALRQIKEADPKRYQQLINASKDFSMSTGETAVEMGMISPQDLAKYMKGEHAQPNIRPEDLWSE